MGLRALAVAIAILGANTAFAQAPQLIGGTPADPKDWPASVYARMGSAACSATVVGERVLLIASHCVSNGGTARFAVGANQYSAVCTHTPGYPGNSTYDWTLCLVDRKVEGIVYESLAPDGDEVKVGLQLQLTGYGCIRAGGGGGNDGVFRIGKSPVTQTPGVSGRDADIVTRGTAALCYGDSGGAAYVVRADGSREIVGVNSRGNISTTSYLPAVYHEKFKAQLQSWSAAKGVRICGVHADAEGCRDSAGDELPPDDECMKYLETADKAFGDLKACLSMFD